LGRRVRDFTVEMVIAASDSVDLSLLDFDSLLMGVEGSQVKPQASSSRRSADVTVKASMADMGLDFSVVGTYDISITGETASGDAICGVGTLIVS
jgi:hypothetical protein